MTSFAEGSDEAPAKRFNRAAVFANPVSGGGAALKLLTRVEQMLHARGLSANISLSSSAADLESQVHREVDSGTNLLISAGGDGTLHSIVNASLGKQVVYGVIPAGGGNDFARALGLPLRPILALELALAGDLKSVDLVKVRNAASAVRIYLGGGGVGLDSDTAELSSQRLRFWPGRLRYIAAAVCAFTRYPARRIRILTDNVATQVPWQQAIIASVLNTPSFGAGIRLIPDAKIDDGLVDVAVRERLGIGELLRVLPRLIATGSLSLPGLRVFRARNLRIETEPPVLFQGDGELLGYTPVEIEVLPGAATFLVPKRAGG